MSLIININVRVYMKWEPVTDFYNPFFKISARTVSVWHNTDTNYCHDLQASTRLWCSKGTYGTGKVFIKLHIMPWVKWLENTNLTKSCNNSLRLLSCLHTVKLLNFIFMTYMCVKNITTASKEIWFYLSQPPQLFIWIRKTFLHSNNIIWSNCATTFFSSYLIFFTKWIKLKKG